jgi:hypothetical protein
MQQVRARNYRHTSADLGDEQSGRMVVVLALLVAAMNGWWIYTLAWLFGAVFLSTVNYFPLPSPILLSLAQFSAWGLAYLLRHKARLPLNMALALAGLAGLPVALAITALAIPPIDGISGDWIAISVYAILVCLLLWFQGIYYFREGLGFNNIYLAFRLELLIMGITVLLTALIFDAGGYYLWTELGSTTLWAFAWSLAALAISNQLIIRDQFGRTGGGSSRFLLLAISIGGVLLIGSIAGLFGGQDFLTLLGRLMRGFLLLIATGVYTIFYLLYMAVAWLASLLGIGGALEPFTRALSPPTHMSPLAEGISIWVAIGLVIVVAFRWINRQMRDAGLKVKLEDGVEREGLDSMDLLQRQSTDWLNRLASLFRFGSGDEYEDDLQPLLNKPEWAATVAIRRLYMRLESAATTAGHPRAPGQTPAEFLAMLASSIPQHRAELSQISTAYIEARYAPRPASELRASAASDAYKRLEPSLKTVPRSA